MYKDNKLHWLILESDARDNEENIIMIIAHKSPWTGMEAAKSIDSVVHIVNLTSFSMLIYAV